MQLSARYRTALVTGAGSGLGAAFSAMLLAEGLRVWGTTRDLARLPAREDFSPVALELGDPGSINAAWEKAEAESGGIDLLVNNAGAAHFGVFCDAGAADWEREFSVLALAPTRLARLAFRAMRSRARGCIVNVTSLAVDFPIPYMSGYNAGKAALAALSASLHLEAAGAGVTVIDFRAGDHRTNFNRAMASTRSSLPASGAPARVWARLEQMMAASPTPDAAARSLRHALLRGRGGVVRSGSFFQARVAPALARIAPAPLAAWVHARYFRLR